MRVRAITSNATRACAERTRRLNLSRRCRATSKPLLPTYVKTRLSLPIPVIGMICIAPALRSSRVTTLRAIEKDVQGPAVSYSREFLRVRAGVFIR